MSRVTSILLSWVESIDTFLSSYRLGRIIVISIKNSVNWLRKKESAKENILAQEIAKSVNQLFDQINESEDEMKKMIDETQLLQMIIEYICQVILENKKWGFFPILPLFKIVDKNAEGDKVVDNNEMGDKIVAFLYRRQSRGLESIIELMFLSREEIGLSKNATNLENLPEDLRHEMYDKQLRMVLKVLFDKGITLTTEELKILHGGKSIDSTSILKI